ncbi:hypothetical protein OG874_26490 [Nocardia sp. NBC_00565]|uniref:hypothetical protein n=1 Tax=Nocardia sp. NBC_00565 TaxID=2975993 RepID=UPI002E823B33|nr:hypothetical protein [Nocardia sp. NBC_00565]WUC00429.1 hypothetical protein OG874_26490 [Nocardia sp. NBC_00565]
MAFTISVGTVIRARSSVISMDSASMLCATVPPGMAAAVCWTRLSAISAGRLLTKDGLCRPRRGSAWAELPALR